MHSEWCRGERRQTEKGQDIMNTAFEIVTLSHSGRTGSIKFTEHQTAEEVIELAKIARKAYARVTAWRIGDWEPMYEA